MVITLSTPIPCGYLLPAPTLGASFVCCGFLATSGFVSPLEGAAWELLPICPQHMNEVAMITDEDTRAQEARPSPHLGLFP
jgi:hypothetical protein